MLLYPPRLLITRLATSSLFVGVAFFSLFDMLFGFIDSRIDRAQQLGSRTSQVGRFKKWPTIIDDWSLRNASPRAVP